ncbi:MAG: hypothetical protein LUI13_13780 [Lachnospiraceae bacterium]|nr:hypothetical protein [Lachnospiraceae bacterium]
MKRRFLKTSLAAGVIMTALCLTGCSKTVKINLNDYVMISYSGYNGYGKVNTTLDYSSLKEDYGEKLSLSSDALYFGCTTFGEFVDWMEEIEYGASVSPDSELSNGDTVTVSLNELAADIQLYTEDDIDINYSSETYTVSGLEELPEEDVFDYVSVSFTGIAPEAEAELTVSGVLSDEGYFEMSQKSGLNIGDVVTVSIDDYYIEDIIKRMGYKPTVMSKDYVVEGISYYLPSLDELPDTASAKMEERAKAAFDSIVAGWNDPTSLKSCDLLGYYFLYNDKSSGYSGNEIILVYEYHTDQKGEDVTAYWYCKFTDGIVMTDGTFSMDYSDYSAPTGSWLDFGSPSFTYTSSDGMELSYPGYSDLDSMYYQLITLNMPYYSTYESTVGK